jgi:hypothetical protein
MYSQSSIHRQLIIIENFRFIYLAGRLQKITVQQSIGCSFKLILKFSVKESIVNAPLVHLLNKNTNNAKSEVKFKQLIRDL